MENSPLAIEIVLAALSGLILVLVVALPLLPAILIYKIFPDSHIKASGTIGALTWNASGAFAAYMIVLGAILFSPLDRLTSAVGGFYTPAWTVEMEIHGYDQNAQPVQFNNIEMILNPEIHRISGNKAVLRIPGLKRSDWPVAHFQIVGGGGSMDVNLASLREDEIDVDHFSKHVKILTPVVLRQVTTSSDPYPPPGAGYLNQPGNDGGDS